MTNTTDPISTNASPSAGWLSEPKRSLASLLLSVVVSGAVAFVVVELASTDAGVIGLVAYLLAYCTITLSVFSHADPPAIKDWADRERRGTIVQRYLLGTAPGPGVSLTVAVVALVITVVWLPGHVHTELSEPVRVAVSVGLVVAAWVCVLASFAVTYHADDLIDEAPQLQFPGDDPPQWSDYLYFSVGVMTTFGATDVNVVSRAMRRTVTAHAMIAFVFNTVVVAAVVSTFV